jgi:TonB family protein
MQDHILKPRKKHVRQRVGTAFVHAALPAGGAPAGDFPMTFHAPDAGKSTVATGAISAAIHGGLIALLVILASLKPEIIEDIIPVTLLKEEPVKPPAPARRALAERRKLDFAPAVQAIQPQIVNPRVIADAAPAVHAETLKMDAVSAVSAPRQVSRSAVSVDRVSAVGSVGGYRASSVDVPAAAGPVVRGPVRAAGRVGPSVGPRKVVGTTGTTVGTGSLAINAGSSVRDGVISGRDVVGSPTGARLASVNTAVGEGHLKGGGGTGTGLFGGAAPDCMARPEVQTYLGMIQQRVISRWNLPYAVTNAEVMLKFSVDAAGSASRIELARGDNALGASAIDAMRAASPFPAMPDRARCLAAKRITGTFSSSSVAG